MRGLQSIEASLRASRLLIAANAAGHVLAAGAVVAIATDYPLVLAALVPLGYQAWVMHQRMCLAHPRAWQSFRWTFDNRIHAQRVDGGYETGECLVARRWGAAWVQLTVRLSGQRALRFVVLPADAVDAECHRRLRVRVQVGAPQHLARQADSS